MKTTSLIITLFALLVADGAQAAQGTQPAPPAQPTQPAQPSPIADIQPGNWNVEMKLAMGGMPIPAQQDTLCLSNVKQLVNNGAGCSVKTTSTSGNHVNMAISCNMNGMQMDGTGDLTFTATKVDGTLNLSMQMGGDQAVETVTTLHAVRLGECPKQGKAAQ